MDRLLLVRDAGMRDREESDWWMFFLVILGVSLFIVVVMIFAYESS